MIEKYNVKTLLEIVLKVTNKNANILAHSYLLKDESIISKWKKGKAYPKNDDIIRIVEFVKNESTLSQQKILRDKIEGLIRNNSIKSEIKNIILNAPEFSDFLREALSASVSLNENCADINDSGETEDTEDNNLAELVKNKSGRLKGVMEFELVLTQGNEIKASCRTMESNMELNGKVNLDSENKLVKTVKYVKKAAAYGAFFLLIVSGIIIAVSQVDNQNDLKDPAGDTAMSKDVVYYESKVSTPAPTQRHAAIISPTPLPATSEKPEETKDYPIINNGNNSVIIVGNQNSFGIEKD